MNITTEFACQIQGARGEGQDRALAVPIQDGHLFVIADGAGGSGSGALAAQTVVDALSRTVPADASQVVDLLLALDQALAAIGGETTAVVAVLRHDQVFGASVGDSRAQLIGADGCIELTARQHRKPLLGSGMALPVAFGPQPFPARLLLASDGLFNYAPAARIADLVRASPPDTAIRELVAAVRLPNGVLQDDIAVIIAAGRPDGA